MKRYFITALLMIVPLYGVSKATEEIVKSMVPYGEVSQKIGKDYLVRTKAGTKVLVEFDRTGNMDEASGLNLGKGDTFEPGNGLLTLDSIAQGLKNKGHEVRGDWRLEKDSILGWVYELAGTHLEEPAYFVVDAKSSQLIKTED